MLSCAGYPCRYVAAENNYLFDDTGMISEMRDDFEAGRQSISDCKQLLETFQELQRQSGQSAPVTTTRLETIVTEAGREWSTTVLADAIILCWAGYPLLRTRVEVSKVVFIFGYNDDTKPLLKQFNDHQLMTEPHAYANATRTILNAMREARQVEQVEPPAGRQYKSPSEHARDAQRAQERQQSKQQPMASGLSSAEES
jgi:hypothetical protein